MLKLTSHTVDTQLSREIFTKIQCGDNLFDVSNCYTYITVGDFEIVFTMDKLIHAIITSYMM